MRKFLSQIFIIFFFILIEIFNTGIIEAKSPINSYSLSKFQKNIIDYRHNINKKFKKKIRKKTKYIIIHTSELGKYATLKVLSKGKNLINRYKTPGGHAHYAIARNGQTYRILDKKYIADHAGLSMWDGQKNISNISIGIELVGYHNASLTDKQYKSVKLLLNILKKVYSLPDKNILTHSQIAYGKPNPWFKKNHRGRKRCARNFNRKKAGLKDYWSYDPDVRSRKLLPDPQLSVFFYSPNINNYHTNKKSNTTNINKKFNIITLENSAWSIAGEKYDSSSTIYILPGGQHISGKKIPEIIGWKNIPVNTKVLLNQNISKSKSKYPIKIIKDDDTAWSYAGLLYNNKNTFYILPSGKIISGINISDWDDLPIGTKLIINYNQPQIIKKNKTAFSIARFSYNSPDTIYYIPPNNLKSGTQIKKFNKLPQGTKIFLPLKK